MLETYQKIKYYRARAKMCQLELELAIGASNGSVSRIESGQTNPSKETLLKIAQALKLNFIEKADLLGISISEEELISFVVNKLHLKTATKVRLH